ncbi:3-phosphoinositide-dependent protein kinase [Dirofilaria immitis]
MMNFNWANELAKNALKTAQKRIDSVLDITPEDEIENDEDASDLVNTSVDQALEQENQSGHHKEWNEANSSCIPIYDGTSGIEVVDSEPNPIRDSHHAGLLPHSPSSNSPEEELVCNEEQDIPHSNNVEKHKDSELLEQDNKHFVAENSSHENNKHHDDTLTLISSDFEVLRHSDSCSMASSVPPKTLTVLLPDASTIETHEQAKQEDNSDLQPTSAEIAHLRTQIQYQERRIRDLQFQNQRLEAKSKELLAFKAMRTQQSTAEARLLKKLNEKETKLADLLQEGEKLAEMNGKLSKELKRLRANLAEQEQLAKKSTEAETSRDLAREEARGLAAEITKLRAVIKSLELDLAELKMLNESLTNDLKKKDDKISKLLADVQQSQASRELANEKLRRLETAFEEVSIKVKQEEMSSKSIEEITLGLNADLEEEKKKNERQTAYIDSLEKRLGEMMETQQNNAEMIATVSAPLLESIHQLEEKISVKDNEYEQTVCEKEISISTLNLEKGHLLLENEKFKKENEEDDKNINTEDMTCHSDAISESKRLTESEEKSKGLRTRSDFIFLNELGEGSFSTVYHVREKSTGRELAAKVCFKKQIIRERKIDYIFREKEALIRLSNIDGKHPFLAQIMCTFQDTENLYIIMTLAKKGDLLKLMRKSGGKFNLNLARFYTCEIVAALEHMHSLKIIHRDLKPENILISETGHILVSDFGSAKILDRAKANTQTDRPKIQKRRSSFVGTPQFVSPEVLKGEPVQQACDYWALGVIIYQLLTGKHAFYDVAEYLIYRRILSAAYKIPDDFPEIAANIVRKLLIVKVTDRLGSVESGGAETVKKEPFFDGIKWDSITETEFRERIQNDLATIERLNKHARQIEQQNSILEMNSSKLLHKIEELTKKLSEKEDEIGKVYVQLSDEADTFEKRIMQKQNEVDDARKYSEVLEKELHQLKMQNGERLMEQEKIQEFLPNGSSFMLSIPNHALQIELADALAKYEKSMRQISTLEGKISSMEAESQYVDSLRHELQALRLRYENLLEAHGEKIERIEELELDLADLKKLLKDQKVTRKRSEFVKYAFKKKRSLYYSMHVHEYVHKIWCLLAPF